MMRVRTDLAPRGQRERNAVADRWPPTTRADLELALANGLLEESHFLDLKRELPPAGRNAGIAADLAAFSIDSGVICFGLDESTVPPTITPIPLDSAAERIEQVGLASVDPPVRVRSHRIEMEPSGYGVLVVVVPPSVNAPHMAGASYRGRGDRTNYVLSDAEVRRVQGELAAARNDVEEDLKSFAQDAMRRHGNHTVLLMVARPSPARETLLLDCAGPDPLTWITRVLLEGPLTRPLTFQFGSDFSRGLEVEPSAGGWAIHRSGFVSDARVDLVVIGFNEDGGIRLEASGFDDDNASPRMVQDPAVNGLVLRVLLAAAEIGQRCSHFGTWTFALSLGPLRGSIAWSAHVVRDPRLRVTIPPYAEEFYVQTAAATYEELAAGPSAIRERLLGRLNRAFGGPHTVKPEPV